MYIFVLILGVLLSMTCVIMVTPNTGIMRKTVYTFTAYMFSFILAAQLIFAMDSFTLEKSVNICAVFWAVLSVVILVMKLCGMLPIHYKNKKKDKLIQDMYRELIPVLAILLMLPFVWNKFEFYGMGRDEGVYQTQALCFMNGITSRQYDFPEYYKTESDTIRDYINYAVGQTLLRGFYNNSQNTGYVTDALNEPLSERSGVFHGIPAYSALMALWGSVFGYENMSVINTFIFIACTFMIGYICMEFGVGLVGILMAVLGFATSPLVVWVCKASLTEMGYTLIFLAYLYAIIKHRKYRGIYLSVLPLFVLDNYHVSAYVFVPLFLLIYIFIYMREKNVHALFAALLSIILYYISFWLCYIEAPVYLIGNMRPVFKFGVNSSNVHVAVTIVCILEIFFVLAVYLLERHLRMNDNKKYLIESIIYKIIFAAAIIAILYFRKRDIISNNNWQVFTLVVYIIVGAIIIPVFTMLHTLVFTGKWLKDTSKALLLICFTYTVIIYSVVFKPYIPYLFYYARYIAMFIPLIAIMAAVGIEELIKKLNKTVRIIADVVMGIICVATIAIGMPYNYVMLKQNDATRVEWKTIDAITEKIEPGSAVVMDAQLYKYLYFPVVTLSGADVYPEIPDIDGELEELKASYDNVYYINEGDAASNAWNLHTEIITSYTFSKDYNKDFRDYELPAHDNIFKYPMEFVQESRSFTLSEYNLLNREQFCSADSSELYMDGFGEYEDAFRWSITDKPSVKFYLKKDYYTLKLHLGIPTSILSFDTRPLRIMLNGIEIYYKEVSESDLENIIEIPLDYSIVQNGSNILQFEFDVWSAAEENISDDLRKLGFMFFSMELK